MNIVVLNGSPKGETSVTMQYVAYIQKRFPQHKLEIVNVAQRIRKIEQDQSTFDAIVERVRAADGVLWAFPLYILLVHAGYKRFIELLWERDAEQAFEGKYAAALSTSIHFFDNTAHDYVRAICDDMGMPFAGAFAANMPDLLEEEGQQQLASFAEGFFRAIEQRSPLPRSFAPVTRRTFDYLPGPVNGRVDLRGRKLVIVSDAEPGQHNLLRMIERFRQAFDGQVEVVNLRDLDIKGGCLGCLRCGYNYECAYTGRDDFIDFYNGTLKTADVLVFAGAIKDRYLSSTWKNFFDRSFFNTHTPSLIGKQFGFLISGPLEQLAGLRQVLDAWVQIQRSNLVGFVSDEQGDAAEIDALLQGLAERLAWGAEHSYVQPRNFLGVGGMKIFRDDIWGHLRAVFRADHRAYRRMGIYDFPQNNLRGRLQSAVLGLMMSIPGLRKSIMPRFAQEMTRPYQKVLGGDRSSQAPLATLR